MKKNVALHVVKGEKLEKKVKISFTFFPNPEENFTKHPNRHFLIQVLL